MNVRNKTLKNSCVYKEVGEINKESVGELFQRTLIRIMVVGAVHQQLKDEESKMHSPFSN